MALTFSEGSIGGDIEKVNLNQLEAFYGKTTGATARSRRDEHDGRSEPRIEWHCDRPIEHRRGEHPLLLINPHTSFFFRAEAQMVSDEGLNAYGAITWGQFFIYQGFNDRAGWMHTSSGVDNIDEYLETVTKKGDGFTYRYGAEERPVTATKIVGAVQDLSRHGAERIHRLSHAPWTRGP